MDRKVLEDALNHKYDNNVRHMIGDERDKIFKAGSEKLQDGERDFAAAIEEMCELSQLLTKIIRGCSTSEDLELELMEEIADVRITLEILHYRFKFKKSELIVSAQNMYSIVIYDRQCAPNDTIFNALTELSKLIYLCAFRSSCTNYLVKEYFVHVYAEIYGLISKFNINEKKLRYIEDIKLERIRDRLKNGENL